MGGKCPKKLRATARILSMNFQTKHRELHETIFAKRLKSYNPSYRNEQLNPRQDIANSIINLTCSMEGKNFNASISNIILRTDNKKLNQKDQEVSTHLKELYKEKNIYLIDNISKIKAQHLMNKGKLHLNKRGYNILISTFIGELSRILN